MEGGGRYVLILAAGESARFAAAGYTGPKAALPIQLEGVRKRMLDHVLERLPSSLEPIVVTRREWSEALSGTRQILLDGPTRGQSETVLRALEQLGSCSVMIHNCDVLIDRVCLRHMADHSAFSIALHRESPPLLEPPPYSYVNKPLNPSRYAEKERISEWAVAGAWWFEQSFFLHVACRSQLDCQPEGEVYLSGALQGITLQGFGCILTDLGTPEAVARAGGIIG